MSQDVHSLLEGYREQIEGLAKELQGLRSARASAEAYATSLEGIAESLGEVVAKLQPLTEQPDESRRRLLKGVEELIKAADERRQESSRLPQNAVFVLLVLNLLVSGAALFRSFA